MVALWVAYKYNRKLIETVPVGVYLFILLSYLLAVSGHIGHITGLLLLFEAAGLLLTAYQLALRKREFIMPFKDPGNAVFAVMLVIMWVLSLHMRVTNFDDFHSWAITPKDMFYVNGLPTGGMASTFYRDYFPTVYVIDFLALRLIGEYRESIMFFVLWTLMLVSLSPFLHRNSEDGIMLYICRVAAGMMLPFLMSFQFLHSLGLDILATTVFGSALVYIMCKDRRGGMDGYEYIRIVLAVTILGMLKTTSLILAFVCIGMYFVRFFEVKNRSFWLRTVFLFAASTGFWLSWKIFCRIKGNTTYLSDNLEKNLSSGHAGLPDYAASTIKDFTVRLFTYGLNDGRTGLSSIMILMLFVISFIIYMRRNGRKTEDRLTFAVILLGMAGYLLVMLYVYLFVFEEWEAVSLSSYDRYIATYFGAMLYLSLFLMLAKEIKPVWTAPVLLLLLVFTINFEYVGKTLIPSGYEAEYGELVSEIDSIEEEFMQGAGERPVYGESILIVDDRADQLRAKVLPYAAVHGVTRLLLPSEGGKIPGETEIAEAAAEYNARVIDLRRNR